MLFGRDGVDPFAELAQLAPSGQSTPESPAEKFATAHVGLLCFEMVHFSTKVDKWPDSARGPIARLLSECTVVVFDHLTQRITVASTDEEHVRDCEALLRSAPHLAPFDPPDPSALPSDVELNMDDAAYSAAMERSKTAGPRPKGSVHG